jgi:hypothetical protein
MLSVSVFGSPAQVMLESVTWATGRRSANLVSAATKLTLRNVKLQRSDNNFRIILNPLMGQTAGLAIHTVHGNATLLVTFQSESSSNSSGATTFNLKMHDTVLSERFSVAQLSLDQTVSNVYLNRSTFAAAGHPILPAVSLVNLTLGSLIIDRCNFIDDLLLASGRSLPLEQAVVSILNSTFDGLASIKNGLGENSVGYNLTLRGTRFSAQEGSFNPSIFLNPQDSPYIWADARGNYWGDIRGPRSCCNPNSNGSTNVWADASSWCLDDLCTALSANMTNITLYGVGYTPSWCHYDQICHATTSAAQYSLIGLFCGLFLLSLLAVLRYYLHIRKGSEASALLVSNLPRSRHRVLYVLNISGGLFSTAVMAIVFLPIFYLQEEVLPEAAVRSWVLYAATFLVAVCALRVGCNVWSILIMSRCSQSYRSLLGNITFSGIVVVLSVMWRFSAWALTPTIENPQYTDMILRTGYYWIITGLFAGSEIFFAIPSIFLSLSILKQRDYAEVEGIKQSLVSNPLGDIQDLLQSQQLRRVATAGVLVCLVLALLYLIGIPIALFVLLPAPKYLAFSTDELLGISLAAHFAACAIASLFGAFFFRRRPYDPTYGTAFLAVSLATIAMMLEVVVFTGYDNRRVISKYAPDIVIMLFAVMGMMIPAGLTGWILFRLRKTLASDMARNAYQKFENALAE